MTVSKIKFLKANLSPLLALSMMASALVSCNLPTPMAKKDSTGLATFYVSQVSGFAADTAETTSSGLPQTKTITFQACLVDHQFNKALSLQKFKILETAQVIEADSNGCIKWNENINYDVLAQSKYVVLNRAIESLGLQKGAVKAEFAVNFWNHGENQQAVLKPDSVDANYLVREESAVQALVQGQNKRPLWVEDARLFTLESVVNSTAARLSFEFKTVPSVIVKKMTGENFFRPITKGEYQIRFTWVNVISENNQEIRDVLFKSEWLKSSLLNGTLSVQNTLSVDKVPSRGNLYLALELKALEDTKRLTPFEGLFYIGDYSALKSTPWLKASAISSKTENFSLEKYLKEGATKDEAQAGTWSAEQANDQQNYKKAKIEFSEMEATQVLISQETNSTQDLFFKIKTCPYSTLDDRAIKAQKYLVSYIGQNTKKPVEVETDQQGCLHFTDTLKVNTYAQDCFIDVKYNITQKSMNLDETLHAKINPWNKASYFFDARFAPQLVQIKKSCSGNEVLAKSSLQAAPQETLLGSSVSSSTLQRSTVQDSARGSSHRTEIFLDSYSYSTKNYNSYIDHNLNLVFNKTVRFKFDPKVISYNTATNGRNQESTLKDGLYALKLAIVKNSEFSGDQAVVQYIEKIAAVIGGTLNVDVQLETINLKALANRNKIIIEVLPVHENLVYFADEQYKPVTGQTLESVINYNSGLALTSYTGMITIDLDELARPLWRVSGQEMAQWFTKEKIPLISQSIMPAFKTSYLTSLDHFLKAQNLLKSPEAFAKSQGFKLILDKVNAQDFEKHPLNITNDDVTTILKAGQLTKEQQKRVCVSLIHSVLKDVVYGQSRMALTMNCMNSFGSSQDNFLEIKRHLLIGQVIKSKLVKGTNEGLSLGASVSLSYANSKSFTNSTSVGIKAGASYKFLEFLSVGIDAGKSLSWSESTSDTDSTSTGFGAQTSLLSQRNLFEITATQTQKCVTLRLKPALFVKKEQGFFTGMFSTEYLDYLNPKLSREQKLNAIRAGIMICESKVEKNPLKFQESYYLINQQASAQQQQDAGDERNRQFFMSFRTDMNYLKFKTITQSQLQKPAASMKDHTGDYVNFDMIKDKVLEIDQIAGQSVYSY